MAALLQDFSTTVMPISSDDRLFFVRLGERIAQLRKAHQITQAQLAHELNVAQQTLQGYEAGTRRIPVSALPVVARALSVSMEDLFVQGEQPSRRPGASTLCSEAQWITPPSSSKDFRARGVPSASSSSV